MALSQRVPLCPRGPRSQEKGRQMFDVVAAALIAFGDRGGGRLLRAWGAHRPSGIGPGGRRSRRAPIGRGLGGTFGGALTVSAMSGWGGRRLAHPGDRLT